MLGMVVRRGVVEGRDRLGRARQGAVLYYPGNCVLYWGVPACQPAPPSPPRELQKHDSRQEPDAAQKKAGWTGLWGPTGRPRKEVGIGRPGSEQGWTKLKLSVTAV